MPGSEYCKDPVFRAACRACGIQEGLEARATSETSTTSTLPPWHPYSHRLGSIDLQLDVPANLDALIEDPDDRPYLWDLPEEPCR